MVLDEFTMVGQTTFNIIDKRLHQIMCIYEPFGGVVVVMFGDPAQFPPVGANSLWIDICNKPDDIQGYCLYRLFTDCILLTETNRLDRNDPNYEAFESILHRLRDGLNTEEDWNLIREKCSYFSMGREKWIERGFDDKNVVHMERLKSQVLAHNKHIILQVGNPIALIESENTEKAATMRDDHFNGLDSSVYLCRESKIMLTRNYLSAGLSNGSVGLAKEFIYDSDKSPPHLPHFIFVDFGAEYKGKSFFPNDISRKGWFPIFPVTNKAYSTTKRGEKGFGDKGFTEHSRTMLPIKLCWAWTVWKVQGMTIPDKAVVRLTDYEPEHGYSYVAFSRLTRLTDIGLEDGITKNRLCSSIRKHSKMKRRIEEEKRLKIMSENTIKTYLS